MLSIEEIVKASNGKKLNGTIKTVIKSYCIDSRQVNFEDFFIPLVGNNHDAHSNILDCVNKGIPGFFINSNCKDKEEIVEKSLQINSNVIVIEVEDTKKALMDIARYNRQKYIDVPIIAVTGSVGKTSTREIISSIFERSYKILKTEKNYNSDIGISLMLLKIEDQEICILEAGISNLGEMSILSELLRPTVAVITNIGISHIGFLKTRQNIFEEKLKITEYIKAGGYLVVNEDDEFLKELKDSLKYKVIKYSRNQANEAKISSNVEYKAKIYNKNENILLNVTGEHNIYNSLCAIRVGEIFNISTKDIKEGLKEYNSFNRRFQIIKLKNGCDIIDDAYNASYDSIKVGLESFNYLSYKRKLVVLGDILELGDASKETHINVGKLLQRFEFDKICIYGNESKYTYTEALKYVDKNKLEYFSDKSKLTEDLKRERTPGTAIYFKASNGMKFDEVINAMISY